MICRLEAEESRKAEAASNAEVAKLEGAVREVRGKLEQKRSESQNQRSKTAVIQALMQAKQAGQIRGIYGRLGKTLIF